MILTLRILQNTREDASSDDDNDKSSGEDSDKNNDHMHKLE